jgi:signal transduction histidine kinase
MFLANMSHELRTPMHGILSFSRFGQQRLKTIQDPELESYFKEIYESGSRLMSLLNDLLDLSKLEAGKAECHVEECNFNQIVESIFNELSAFALEKGIKMQLQKISDDMSVIVDYRQMQQVLRNLISNALKFSEKDSTIHVTMRSEKDLFCFSVTNKGLGIPKSELETIFDKFVQSSKTKTGAGGTGLGLSICKEIVHLHKGRIWADSKNGITTFTVELPPWKLAA